MSLVECTLYLRLPSLTQVHTPIAIVGSGRGIVKVLWFRREPRLWPGCYPSPIQQIADESKTVALNRPGTSKLVTNFDYCIFLAARCLAEEYIMSYFQSLATEKETYAWIGLVANFPKDLSFSAEGWVMQDQVEWCSQRSRGFDEVLDRLLDIMVLSVESGTNVSSQEDQVLRLLMVGVCVTDEAASGLKSIASNAFLWL